jgi:hypothetical protein
LLIFEPSHTGVVLGIPREDSPWRLLRAVSTDSAWNTFERYTTLRGWRVAGDSLITVFATPYGGGVGMDFRVAGDSLLGSAHIIDDITGLADPTAPATAFQVSCPPDGNAADRIPDRG